MQSSVFNPSRLNLLGHSGTSQKVKELLVNIQIFLFAFLSLNKSIYQLEVIYWKLNVNAEMLNLF